MTVPPKKNFYEDYLPKTIQEAYIAALGDDELKSLKHELGALRGILSQYMRDRSAEIDGEFIDNVSKLVDKITKLYSAMSQHEGRMREVVPAQMLPIIIGTITNIIRRRVPDARTVQIITEELTKIPNMLQEPPKEHA